MGGKISDLYTIPLCFGCHQERHDHGRMIFVGMDVPKIMLELINEYFAKKA